MRNFLASGQDIAAELIPRITRRCLTDDLGFPANSVDRAMEELADESEVVAAFRERRAAQARRRPWPVCRSRVRWGGKP